jgi:hypothetical protein
MDREWFVRNCLVLAGKHWFMAIKLQESSGSDGGHVVTERGRLLFGNEKETRVFYF